MNKQQKKLEILNLIFKSKDGASWNEVSEMLNEFEQISIAEHEQNRPAIKARGFYQYESYTEIHVDNTELPERFRLKDIEIIVKPYNPERREG